MDVMTVNLSYFSIIYRCFYSHSSFPSSSFLPSSIHSFIYFFFYFFFYFFLPSSIHSSSCSSSSASTSSSTIIASMEFLSFHNIKNDDYADMNTLSSSIKWILDHEALSSDVSSSGSGGGSGSRGGDIISATSHGIISWKDFVKVE